MIEFDVYKRNEDGNYKHGWDRSFTLVELVHAIAILQDVFEIRESFSPIKYEGIDPLTIWVDESFEYKRFMHKFLSFFHNSTFLIFDHYMRNDKDQLAINTVPEILFIKGLESFKMTFDNLTYGKLEDLINDYIDYDTITIPRIVSHYFAKRVVHRIDNNDFELVKNLLDKLSRDIL